MTYKLTWIETSLILCPLIAVILSGRLQDLITLFAFKIVETAHPVAIMAWLTVIIIGVRIYDVYMMWKK
jgi:hypothetical protein